MQNHALIPFTFESQNVRTRDDNPWFVGSDVCIPSQSGARSMIDPLLTTKEAAAILRKAVNTLEVWRVHGNGPKYIRVGGSIRYAESDIKSYIDANRVAMTGE